MIDPNIIRQHPDRVKEELNRRNKTLNVDEFLLLDEKRKALITELDALRAEQNRVGKEVQGASGEARDAILATLKSLKETISAKEGGCAAIESDWHRMLWEFPNISHDDVPVGPDESGNVPIRSWGGPRTFDFPVKDHIELGALHDIIDVERAAKVSGARFAYVKGKLALLQFAVIQHAFNILTNETILKEIAASVDSSIPAKPFVPVLPPVFIRPETFDRMARLEPKEERYHIVSDDQYLVGSAEHTLGSMHMDEILPEETLPLRYVGYSSSFRREAGSYGKDTRGILRVHQFDKIEIESFTTPGSSRLEQDFIVAIQEYLVRSLEIPYQVVAVCTGDMGAPDARQIDIECWLPSQGCYRETHTSDLNTDYQSRRLQTKLRSKDGTSELVHMNDATVFALGRILVMICENYQERDGSIRVPTVLQNYCGFTTIG